MFTKNPFDRPNPMLIHCSSSTSGTLGTLGKNSSLICALKHKPLQYSSHDPVDRFINAKIDYLHANNPFEDSRSTSGGSLNGSVLSMMGYEEKYEKWRGIRENPFDFGGRLERYEDIVVGGEYVGGGGGYGMSYENIYYPTESLKIPSNTINPPEDMLKNAILKDLQNQSKQRLQANSGVTSSDYSLSNVHGIVAQLMNQQPVFEPGCDPYPFINKLVQGNFEESRQRQEQQFLSEVIQLEEESNIRQPQTQPQKIQIPIPPIKQQPPQPQPIHIQPIQQPQPQRPQPQSQPQAIQPAQPPTLLSCSCPPSSSLDQQQLQLNLQRQHRLINNALDRLIINSQSPQQDHQLLQAQYQLIRTAVNCLTKQTQNHQQSQQKQLAQLQFNIIQQSLLQAKQQYQRVQNAVQSNNAEEEYKLIQESVERMRAQQEYELVRRAVERRRVESEFRLITEEEGSREAEEEYRVVREAVQRGRTEKQLQQQQQQRKEESEKAKEINEAMDRLIRKQLSDIKEKQEQDYRNTQGETEEFGNIPGINNPEMNSLIKGFMNFSLDESSRLKTIHRKAIENYHGRLLDGVESQNMEDQFKTPIKKLKKQQKSLLKNGQPQNQLIVERKKYYYIPFRSKRNNLEL